MRLQLTFSCDHVSVRTGTIFSAFILPPGVIDSSVLVAFGEMLTFCRLAARHRLLIININQTEERWRIRGKFFPPLSKLFAMIEKTNRRVAAPQTREQSIAILAAIVTAMKSVKTRKGKVLDMVNGELQHVMKNDELPWILQKISVWKMAASASAEARHLDNNQRRSDAESEGPLRERPRTSSRTRGKPICDHERLVARRRWTITPEA